MNFSKKNHEHQIINIKNVSKKIILGMVFVFATVTMVNAENESLEVPAKCGELAQEVFDSALSQGASYENAMEISDAMYHSCRYLTYLSDYIE